MHVRLGGPYHGGSCQHGESQIPISTSASASTMRRLSLHASALSNPEYDLFTNSLKQIVDDDNPDNADDVHLEKLVVGIREARAWLRGRYSDVSVANIDGVGTFSWNDGSSYSLLFQTTFIQVAC